MELATHDAGSLLGGRGRRSLRRALTTLLGVVGGVAALAGPAWSAEPTPEELKPSANRATIQLHEPSNHEDVLRELRLEQGKSAYLRTDYAVKRVSVGNPNVLDVVVLSQRELQLVAKAVGTTNLVLWDPKGMPKAAINVHVGTPYAHLESELRRVLGNQDIQVDSAGNSVVLKGSVSSALAMEQALTVASAFFGARKEGGIINLLEVGGEQQVMIELVVAEMSRSLKRRLGTNFITITDNGDVEIFSFLNNLTNVQGDLVELSDSINLVGRFFHSSDSYELFFDVLHEKGLGKILAEPTLVARSGESANFLVGGEVPIPVAQGGAFGSITLEFKEFGVGVSFTPTVLSDDRIHLDVTTEVSDLDFSIGTAIGGSFVPGFQTRRAATGIELGDGKSFAIAGLLKNDVSEVVAQYPGLGDIPILGALFRSSQFERQETELVIIATPRLVKPLEPGRPALPTDHFIEPSDFEFYLLGALEARGREEAGAVEEESAIQSGGLIGEAGHRVAAEPQGGEG